MSVQAVQLEAQIPQLRRYARALTGDSWAADDLVQDTLERACDRWQLWKAGTDLRAWLFTLMHNLFIDGARRAVRQAGQRVDIDDVAHELATPAGAADQVLDLQRCLLRLPERAARSAAAGDLAGPHVRGSRPHHRHAGGDGDVPPVASAHAAARADGRPGHGAGDGGAAQAHEVT